MVDFRKLNLRLDRINNALLEKLSCAAGSRFALWAVVAAAAILRGTRFFFDPLISRDGATYIELARTWLAGGQGAVWSNPGSKIVSAPLFIRSLKFFEEHGLDCARWGAWMNLMLSVLTVLMVYMLAKELFSDRRLALFGALCCCFHPILVRQSYELLREVMYLFCFSASLWLFVRSFRYAANAGKKSLPGEFFSLAGSAFFLAAAFLSRFEAIEFIFAAGIFCGAGIFRAVRCKAAWPEAKRMLGNAGLFLLFFLIGLYILGRLCEFSLPEQWRVFSEMIRTRHGAADGKGV